ncbi:MAG: S46 family peptidase [Saprospiraceae bacterium]|nr:S46 family peptidase [Saprospiraceae bacterium]MCF8250657.1 S46 family peptidase [Saprospiraceae bacterium]MCF8280795.1 S46 family peptidase [Bacteroidales bacterium]MCF8312509.1 S46 family peptidase [Saprospiraceae bacterium]MCF8440811.1 S46 family peptidase [Saprospiraceae bacterium]
MKKLILSLTFIFAARLVFAVEGMWLPLLLGMLNETEMKSLGMKMTAEDIYSVNKGSLKDAIVQFGGGCTAEVISGQGLLLTNHHCGFGQIQQHSSLEHNYLEDGFWAKTLKDELPNEGLTVTFISRIEDVTAAALVGVTDDMDKKTRQSTIDKNLDAIKKAAKMEAYEASMIRPFFNGNQYFMFVTITYKDIRLVGTPPSSIGKFGADTDNWVWPRHTGDFSMFRIYADKNNLPAEYSADNVPMKPKHFLPISLDGVAEGDFTLVFGFPGRTNEYLPSYAISQLADVLDPARVMVRDKTLAIWDGAMRADAQVKIQYASKQASLANAWKKWQGEVLGLRKTGAVKKKELYEADFKKLVAIDPKFAKYQNLLPQFEQLYRDIMPYAEAKAYFDEILGSNVELLRTASRFAGIMRANDKNGEAGFYEEKKKVQDGLEGFYKNYRPEIDQRVFAAQMEVLVKKLGKEFQSDLLAQMLANAGGSYEKLAEDIFKNSVLTNPTAANALLDKPIAEAMRGIVSDPACQLYNSLRDIYMQSISPKYNEYNDQIDDLQATYMRAQMAVFPNKKFYPDANSTMRCSYGQVQGYHPQDAVTYSPQTYLEGVMEKYVPGDYEFDVPARLRELYEKKDYGQYGEGGKLPVGFIGSNHTTGGNSGSPAIDAHGNLIGLNFDRVWEGTMSDYNYDPSICRNIMVDARYVLFIVDKYAGATRLIKEMKLVHPKKAVPAAPTKEKARKPQLKSQSGNIREEKPLEKE